MTMTGTVSGHMHYGDVEVAVKRHIKNGGPEMYGSTYEFLDLQIDSRCAPLCCDSQEKSIPLYRYQDIPPFLRGNPYVVSGYRSLLPFSLCCRSLFIWSNETINVWSHLGGCILFILLLIYDNLVSLPSIRATFSDHIIVSLGLGCFQFCLICSAGYHLFNCHSERASKRWLVLDLSGISVGLIGCYLPGVHYAFYCLSIWRDVYLIVISLLFMAVMLFSTMPQYNSQAWFYQRIIMYCGLAAYGVIPTIHWVYLNGGLTAPLVYLFLPKVTVMYLLGILAFFFYITKFPERYFPGHFDYIGSSHQCWHFIILFAFLWWHHAGQQILEYRTNQPCPA